MSADRLTIAQAREVFAVTQMTLYLWRQGSATKAALPVEKPRVKLGEREGAVLIDPEKAVKWANKHGVAIAVDPAKILKRDAKAGSAKPGPKPRADRAPRAKATKAPRRHVAHAVPA